MMRLWVLGLLLAMSSPAFGAPNVVNATQKGSLLVFPDIRVDSEEGAEWNTIIRLQNDQTADIDVLCYWMDGNKHRVDFVIPVTALQPIWFDARSGQGSIGVNVFPSGSANGFDNPFLITPPATSEEDDTGGAYTRGMLACWAVDQGAQHQVKWNHLSGTATVWHPTLGAYEYNAYAFFAPSGLDGAPIGPAGTLNLNGVEYDACPLYQIVQFAPGPRGQRLAIVACTLYLNQDWLPVYTKYLFDAWNADDVKLTGAFRCADSWHESPSGTDPIQNTAIRVRLQGVPSDRCEVDGDPVPTQAVGVLAVQSARLVNSSKYIGSTLANAGKMDGKIVWDPAIPTPEGSIR